MTTSRIVRGTKARVFLYICAVLFITGLIACYNNVRVQLEDTHKSFDLCRQEQENLSTQLQVIYDYKQRLEKSLKTEKGDHQRTKNDLDVKFNEEKLRNEKINGEAKLRFSTLQQHYNLLQTQREDLKEECSKIQRSQLDEINNLQSKLKEVQEQLKAAQNDKDHSVKHLLTQNELLKQDKEKLLQTIQNLKGTPLLDDSKRTIITTTSFSKQVKDKDAHYVFPGRQDEVAEPPEKAEPMRQEDFKNVLPIPSALLSAQSSTQKTLNAVSKADINNVPPLKSPTLTPEPLKKTTSKEMRGILGVLPYPHGKRVPDGVVPVPEKMIPVESKRSDQPGFDLNGFINNRYRANMFDSEFKKNDVVKEKLGKEIDHDVADDNANEEFDIPNNAKADEFKVRNKMHIDGLAAGNKDELEYEGQHLQEGEDDDAADGDNPLDREPQEPAIRN